jgi:hypothetical protein
MDLVAGRRPRTRVDIADLDELLISSTDLSAEACAVAENTTDR